MCCEQRAPQSPQFVFAALLCGSLCSSPLCPITASPLTLLRLIKTSVCPSVTSGLNLLDSTPAHIYQEIKATDMKYKNRVRSRISNLKDPKNPGLRRNVLAGTIALGRIASMSAEVGAARPRRPGAPLRSFMSLLHQGNGE